MPLLSIYGEPGHLDIVYTTALHGVHQCHTVDYKVYVICGFKSGYLDFRTHGFLQQPQSKWRSDSKDNLHLEVLKITVSKWSVYASTSQKPISSSLHPVSYSVCLLPLTKQTLFTILSLILRTTSCSIHYYYLHFTCEENKGQRG